MAIQPVTGACVFISLVNIVFIFTTILNRMGGGLSNEIFSVVCVAVGGKFNSFT